MAALAVSAFVYWMLPGIGVADYPKGWTEPKLLTGDIGGCPDLSGNYDQVDDVVPRLLQGGPSWVKGGRSWFEHRAVVTQADDGSWLRMDFSLNERGLPEHRTHEMTYNERWPRGGTLLLKRRVDYDCEGRWLRSLKHSALIVSKNRAGELIVGETVEVSGQFRLGQLRFGPESVDRTVWRRWLSRPESADAKLTEVYSFEVNRYPWLNKNDTEVVVKISNYRDENICLRLWGSNAADTESTSANAPVLSGTIYKNEGCPPAWLRMPAFGNDNFGLRIPDVAWRIAWRPVATPDATPTVIDVPHPEQLPLMPDQDRIRLDRALAKMTASERVQALEQRRTSDEAYLVRLNEQQAIAQARAAEPKFASMASIRERIQWIVKYETRIRRATVVDGRVHLFGDSPNAAAVSNVLRAINEREPAAAAELISSHQEAERTQFEILLMPCTLTEI